MIERKFVAEKVKEFMIQQYIENTLKNVGHSTTKLVRTPLGEKIIISASRPGLVVGKKGENIKKLTNTLKRRFNLENPQIEIAEVENPNLDAQIVAERVASTIERFGIQKFKAIGHKTMQDVMGAGALGIEIKISGKVPSARAKSWRFYSGYLKKCGNVANTQVKRATTFATLRAGTIGVQVAIMPPGARLIDDIEVRKEALTEEAPKPEALKKRARRKKTESPKKAEKAKSETEATPAKEESQ
ncbi:MAG: 30S ribosomal protein S3 [Candidatus Woesearchaeota archaeon]